MFPPPSGDPEKGEPQGKLDGQCAPDATRSVLNCDIYNGLENWNLSQVTIIVNHSPYGDDDIRVLRVPVRLEPLTTERVAVRLGMQLPVDTIIRNMPEDNRIAHWTWTFAAAQGHRIE